VICPVRILLARTSTFDFGAIVLDVSINKSFYQCPGNYRPLPCDRPSDYRHSSEGIGDGKIIEAPGSPFSQARFKVVPGEVSKGILRSLQKSETKHVDGIAAGDEFWFPYFFPCSKMFARWPTEVISKMRQAINAKQIMIMGIFTRYRVSHESVSIS
jgi:hypothetical protein